VLDPNVALPGVIILADGIELLGIRPLDPPVGSEMSAKTSA
jgi:hypothetical protein